MCTRLHILCATYDTHGRIDPDDTRRHPTLRTIPTKLQYFIKAGKHSLYLPLTTHITTQFRPDTMEASSITQNDIILAWAMPVNLAQLGARLETYAITKAAITTFQIAARNKMLATPHTLPEEIICIIASKVRDVVFKPKMKVWAQVSRCLANECTNLSHLSMDYSMFSSNVSKRGLLKLYEASIMEEHQKLVKRYCKMLSNLDGKSSRFAKCVRVSFIEYSPFIYSFAH